MSEDCVARLTRMVRERVERDEQSGKITVPRPQVRFDSSDSRSVGDVQDYSNDWPEMSQDDWRDQLNPNEGCK